MRRNANFARALAHWAVLVLWVIAGTAHADRTPGYTIQVLPQLAGLSGTARAIDNHGDVAGASFVTGFPNLTQHAVLWQRGKLVDLGATLPGTSLVEAMNDAGTMIGEVGVQPFMWQDGRAIPLPFAGRVSRISHDGTIAGSFFPSGIFNFRPEHAMFFRDGVLHDLGIPAGFRSSTAGDANDHGIVVGSATLNFSSDNHAMVWKNGAPRDLGGLGGHNSFAFMVNDRGDIVGTAETSDNRVMMVRWQVEGGMQVLGEALAPHALNQRGDIAGNNLHTGKPFLWQDGKLTSLLDLPDLRATGWASFSVFAMNDHGQIAGIAFKPNGGFFDGIVAVLTPKG
jgi:uncharacterized membrane protein